jgi:outer membrane protein insertion porin family
VEAIIFHNSGVAVISEEGLRSHVELKPGETFTQAALDRSIKALFATGYFENVYATPEELTPGHVTVTFELTGKLKIRTINFEGNKHMKSKKLQEESGLKPNQVLGADNLAEAVRKLKNYYEKKNYPDVKIVTRTTPLDNAGVADVAFVIDEGMKVKINAISFTGNTHVKAKEIAKVMTTKKASIWSFFTGSGKVQEENNEDDLSKIGELFRNKGFLEVKVTGPVITPYRDGVRLTYNIIEGTRYAIGAQTIEGNTLFKTGEIARAFVEKPGQWLSLAAVEQTSKNIRDLYGSKGYIQTTVHTEMLPTSSPSVLDLKYTIKESKKFTVGTINISGNTTTKSIVVARELLLAPGDVFSSTKMKTSEARLQNTGYFDNEKDNKVKITDEPPANPVGDNQRDMNVAVTEGKTGNVSVGAGYGTLDGPTVFGEFSQGNFDAFNPSNGFRGAGEKLRLFLELGTESNQAILNFEQPWLFDQRLAAGFSLYNTESDYLSDDYNERRSGFEVYLRKRLIELIDGRIGYRFEAVDLFDMQSTASPEIQEYNGWQTVSKVTFNLTRDTRDKVLFSTRGNRLELDTALASDALGGQTDYWLVEGRAAQYFPSFEWPTPQYITLLGRVGTMDGFDGQQVPLFDRFFLGGPNTLRGYGFRKVGPKDVNGEPLGGDSYGFASFEYAFQIAEPLQIATFYDAGFLNSGTGDFSTANYSDNWGVGFRLLIMGAPMRVDYGIPITSRDQGKSGHFWFSFGTRF